MRNVRYHAALGLCWGALSLGSGCAANESADHSGQSGSQGIEPGGGASGNGGSLGGCGTSAGCGSLASGAGTAGSPAASGSGGTLGAGGQPNSGGAAGVANQGGASAVADRPRVDGKTIVDPRGKRLRGMQFWVYEEVDSADYYATQMSQRGFNVIELVVGELNRATRTEEVVGVFAKHGIYSALAYYSRNPGQVEFYQQTVTRWVGLKTLFFMLRPDGGYSPATDEENQQTYEQLRQAAPETLIAGGGFPKPPSYVDYTHSALLFTEDAAGAMDASKSGIPAMENKVGELAWDSALELEKAGVSWVMQSHFGFGLPGSSSNSGDDHDWKDFDAWYAKNVQGTPQDWRAQP